MEDLREQAHGMGGEVITLLGNHEWMNAIGEWLMRTPGCDADGHPPGDWR